MNYADRLTAILKASGWSQEQLAYALKVSFPTLNSWVNKRSEPRKKAQLKIEKLFLNIVGADSFDASELQAAKYGAQQLATTAKLLTRDREVLDKLSLYLTYHTNIIEGSTMTLSDVEEVIFENKVLSNRTAIEQAEARNHQAALLWVLDQLIEHGRQLTLDEGFIKNVHLRIMNGIMSDAGKYRTSAVRILGVSVTLAKWSDVPELVTQLTASLGQSSKDPVAALAKTHAIFEQIHPFRDGNGRTGRLLLLAQALQASLTPPLVVKERRFAYYKYLELAQNKEVYQPLELFVAESMLTCHELLHS